MAECPYCGGDGCEECDQTGERHRTFFEVDGATVSVSSSKPLTAEGQAALGQVVQAALKKMSVDAARGSVEGGGE